MSEQNYKYIYGPVPSWRLGSSLGIDPISKGRKICTFDCVYCQLGSVGILTDERRIFVPAEEIIKEIILLPPVKIDYITFSGTGEPALAANLGEMIKAVRAVRPEKIAVLTNSSLMHRDDVRQELCLSDLVVAKLDAPSQDIFEKINCPFKSIKIDGVIRAIKNFRSSYSGKLALQIMFIEENKECVEEIARIAKEIGPDEVQLNTPLRSCGAKPLTKDAMEKIEQYFSSLKAVSVYKAEKKGVKPISSEDTLKRRGKI